MIRVTSCPDPTSLKRLLDDSLPPEQQGELTGHLDNCPECQQKLEALVGGTASWSGSMPQLDREPPPPDSAYWIALKKLQREAHRQGDTAAEAGAEEELSLDFLDPAKEPGMLGRLGHFDVVEVIGRGGMGVVLKAFDGCLQRPVALKVLSPELANDPTARKRFCREARAAAAITHDNVVAVHQVELEESRDLPYLIMQYVSGVSLQDHLDRTGALEVREIVRIGMQAAAGLAAAHAQGLIHRDIKPANILLEENTRKVKLTDFGLARAAEDLKLTQTGLIAGTPGYMAPEQARGELLDHRTDLFSLGSVLYALSTGEDPFEGSTPYVILQRVTEEMPRPIEEINPEVPVWLVEVIEKLHAKNPEDRFQSAAELADLLGKQLALLDQGSATSLPVLSPKRSQSKPRHIQSRGARILILSLAGLVGAVGALTLTEATGLTRLFPFLHSPPAGTASTSGRVQQGPTPRATLNANAGPIWSVAFSPDGKTLAMGIDDGTIKLWDPTAGRIKTTFEAHKGPIWSARFSPDGSLMATASDDGTVKLWETTTYKEKRTLKHSTAVRAVAFGPDGTRVATGSRDGSVRIWDATKEAEPLLTKGHAGVIMSIAFAPDGKTVASASGDKTVKLWDAETGIEAVTLAGHISGVYTVAFSPDSKIVVSGGWDKTVRLWDAATGNSLDVYKGHEKDIWSVAFCPKGGTLASASEDQTVKLWDVTTGKEVMTFTGHTGSLYAVTYSPDGKTIASGGRDGTVKLWDNPKLAAKR